MAALLQEILGVSKRFAGRCTVKKVNRKIQGMPMKYVDQILHNFHFPLEWKYMKFVS